MMSLTPATSVMSEKSPMLIAHGGTLCPIELAAVASLLAVYLPWFFRSSRSRRA